MLLCIGMVHADDTIYRCNYGSRIEYQQQPCNKAGAREAVLSPRTMRGTVNVYKAAEAGYKSPGTPAEANPFGGEGQYLGDAHIDKLIARQKALANNPVSKTLLASKADNLAKSEAVAPMSANNVTNSTSMWTRISSFFFGRLWSNIGGFLGFN